MLRVRCLRKRHYMRDDVLGAAVEWFNALCVDDYDLPAFRQWQAAQADLEAAGGDEAGAGGDGLLGKEDQGQDGQHQGDRQEVTNGLAAQLFRLKRLISAPVL